MELGNLLFGHSRGQYSISRSSSFERELERLFRFLEPCDYFNADTITYENEVFSLFPYYWGECTCGWDQIDNGQTKARAIECREHCYTHDYQRLQKKLLSLSLTWEERRSHEEREIAKLYEKHNLKPINGDVMHGCAVRCTCDYEERYDAVLDEYAREFGHNGHKPECLKEKDNFLYKPTGFAIRWYKYPLRDAYMNQNIGLMEFRAIIDHCLRSMRQE